MVLFFHNQVNNLKAPALVIMKDIARTEGIGAFYNGLKPTLIRTIPATATLFVTYEYTKKWMTNILGNLFITFKLYFN